MKVIKKINNNVAICLDSHQHELIAFGKGIGFPKTPYELNDLSLIHRTYYGISSRYLALIDEIPEEIFDISARVVDIARNYIRCELNNNIVFTLADHLHFAIKRHQQHLNLKNPLIYDVQYFYEKEMEIGMMAVKMISRELHIHLPREEAGNIALHFVNAEAMGERNLDDNMNEDIINEITLILEKELNVHIKRDDFNYSRFVSHLQYLLKRKNVGVSISSDNIKMYQNMKKEFPKIYHCVLKIKTYIEEKLHWVPSEEELLYLMLHVNRLYAREEL
ncbi:PRD domain-containing protein [Candidatus Stoquefichus sp. SB1]|uniref:PRD domain-containing protein n=1 Tax=Candidatus Stoquefichus sp. SB1 TaxID=1658109 RepID=UPI00067EFD7A|nr:PRD domain-containing protein [Candidatus Stoquefichus sp. SB1]